METKPFKRIRAEELVTDVAGWELPQVSGPSTIGLQQKDPAVVVVEEVIAAEKITVAELEAIRESARLEGLAAGIEEGRQKGLEEGRAQGLEEGKQQGLEQGLEQGRAEIQRLQSLLAQAVAELELPLAETASQIEELLMGYVVALAQATLNAELKQQPELILHSIRGALQQLPEPLTDLQLHLNPQDKTYLENIEIRSGCTFALESDENIPLGSYQLASTNSLVVSDVEERFAALVAQFLEHRSNEGSDANE